MLRKVAPDIRPTYLALARATAQRALLSGRLRAAAAEPLLELLAHEEDETTDAATDPVTDAVTDAAAPLARGSDGTRGTGGARRSTPPAGPVVARTREELREARAALDDGDVAVVMTMGALHEGHATLIHQARQAHRHVVVTIFLNPLQFGPRRTSRATRAPSTPTSPSARLPASTSSSRRRLTSSIPRATPGCASPPGRSATCSRGSRAPATSTACSPSSPSSCT